MKKLILIVATTIVATIAANAASISGEISFAGSYTVNNPNLSSASQFTSFTDVIVADAPTGDYAGTANSAVTMTTFEFKPLLNPAPVEPLWTFTAGSTTYSFDLNTINIDFSSADVLVLTGTVGGGAKVA